MHTSYVGFRHVMAHLFVGFFSKIYDGYPEANDVLGTYCGNNDDIDVSSTQTVFGLIT